MTRLVGESIGRWFRGLLIWRVPARWYAYALIVPVALTVLATAEFSAVGKTLDWSLLGHQLLIYLPSLLFVAMAGGGNEEPGWRGFALPRLQERYSPIRATLVLGALWAPWHLPLLFASSGSSHHLPIGGVLIMIVITLISIMGYAFAYTFLINRTGSVLLCIVLHAGFNTALSSAGLQSEEALQRWDYILLLGLTAATVWAGVAALILVTRGRLGLTSDKTPMSARRPIHSPPAVPALGAAR